MTTNFRPTVTQTAHNSIRMTGITTIFTLLTQAQRRCSCWVINYVQDLDNLARPRCGTLLSSGVMTSSCSVNRAMIFLMKIF